jgi:dihydropteroate synthase
VLPVVSKIDKNRNFRIYFKIRWQMTINCRGKLLDLSVPKVMGILNATPDSFYAGGRLMEESAVLEYVHKMIRDGVDIIDVGGMSSRPGAAIIAEEEELKRVIPVLESILKRFPDVLISIDTIRAKVAQQALLAGAHIINDITAGRFEPQIMSIAAGFKAPFIMMHTQGMPATMQNEPAYENVLLEVFNFFTERIEAGRMAGLTDIILDPGFGFGKNVGHNYTLLRNLDFFAHLHLPILAGLSSKSRTCT